MVLCNASYYGTLAAVRSLGRIGVPVVTVDPAILAVGRYSRYSSVHRNCPPFELTDKWAEWLLGLGRAGPRRAVYATSDAVSFALSHYRDELRPLFHLYQPDVATIVGILDKGRLLEHASSVGIDTPDSWLPASAADAARMACEAGGTLVMKPRSQVAMRSYTKGAVVETGIQARAEYDRLMRLGMHDSTFARQHPEAMLPLLQRYHPEAMEGVYSLSGFRDISGAHFVIRGARKVLQFPRRLGIGLCFEETDVDPVLADRAERLCERIGYYGAFELEFILCGGRALLIDFNGRFYNQLAFDIARGLDQARLVYAGAIGDEEQIARLISAVPARGEIEGMAFCNRFGLSVTIAAQRIFGTMSPEEAKRWRTWRCSFGDRIVDAVGDVVDPLPALVDVAHQLVRSARHPRAFFRQTALAK